MQYPPMDGQRPSDIVTRTGLSKQAVNGLLRDLERLGYITLQRDHVDGRARLIRYTERGWTFFDVGSRLSADVGRRWRREVGADAYRAFERGLRAIVSLDETPSGAQIDPS